LDAKLLARRAEAVRLRDGARLPLTAPDEVAIHGILANGALASVRYHGGRTAGPDFIWEVHGTDGNLALVAESGYANITPLSVRGSRAKAALETMVLPTVYDPPLRHLPSAAINVAAVYAQLAKDLREGSALAPGFETALRRHRLLAAIERSSALGATIAGKRRDGEHRQMIYRVACDPHAAGVGLVLPSSRGGWIALLNGRGFVAFFPPAEGPLLWSGPWRIDRPVLNVKQPLDPPPQLAALW